MSVRKIALLLTALLGIAAFATCGHAPADEPAIEIIASDEYDMLNQTYLIPCTVTGVFRNSWHDASEVDADAFVSYYIAYMLQEDEPALRSYPHNADGTSFAPQGDLEAVVQAHFSVSTEHLRASSHYNADEETYALEGIGGAYGPQVTNAYQKDNILTIEFDVIGGDGQPQARGIVHIEMGEDTYRYISCEMESITP